MDNATQIDAKKLARDLALILDVEAGDAIFYPLLAQLGEEPVHLSPTVIHAAFVRSAETHLEEYVEHLVEHDLLSNEPFQLPGSPVMLAFCVVTIFGTACEQDQEEFDHWKRCRFHKGMAVLFIREFFTLLFDGKIRHDSPRKMLGSVLRKILGISDRDDSSEPAVLPAPAH